MPTQLEFAQAATFALVRGFHQASAGDRCCIGTFGSSYSLVQPFTPSELQFHSSLMQLSANGGMTRFRDSLYDFAKYFQAHARRNRPWLIIVITDGDDNTSRLSPGTVGAYLRPMSTYQNRVFIFTIGVGNNINQTALQNLAAQGGYRHTGLESFERLELLFQLIALQVVEQVTGIHVQQGNNMLSTYKTETGVARMGIDYGFLIDISSSMSAQVSIGGTAQPAPVRTQDPQPQCCTIL